MAAASDTPTSSTRWLYGPGPDLLIGCGVLYALVILIYSISGPQIRALHPPYLLALLVLLAPMPHYGATLLRVYERRADRKAYVAFTVYTTVALCCAFAYGAYNTFFASLLLTLYMTWSPWHYTGQNYGLAVMFLHRRGVEVTPTAKMLLHWSFRLSYVLVFLVFHSYAGPIAYSPESLVGSQVTFLPLGIPQSFSGVAFPIILVAYLGCVLGSGVLLLRGASFADIGPTAMLVVTQALWFTIPFGIQYANVTTGIEPFDALPQIRDYVLMVAVGHSIQYLWITSYYAKASPGWNGKSAYFAKAAFAGIAVWTVPVIVLAPDGLGSLAYDAGLAMLLAASVNLHHFILDGAIWRLRDSRVANVLLKSQQEATSAEEPEHEWVRLGVWAVAMTATAIAIFVFWEREIAVRQALETRDYAAVSEILDKLAWVGRDDSTLRRTLALGAVNKGDMAVAVHQLKRHVELRPTVQGYGELAAMLGSMGEWEEAIRLYDAGLELEPEHPTLIRGTGLAWLELNQPDLALELLEPLSRRHPDDQKTLDGLRRARDMTRRATDGG